MIDIGDFVDSFQVEWDSETTGRVKNLAYYAKTASGSAATSAVADVIPGGQFLGQAIIAASSRQPKMRVQSVQAIFGRIGRVSEQTTVVLDEIHSSSAFASYSMKFMQKDRSVATAIALLHVPDADIIRHGPTMGAAGNPEAPDFRLDDRGGIKFSWEPGINLNDAEKTGPARVPMWLRYNAPPAGEALNQALLAFGVTFQFIGTALHPHKGFSTGQAHTKITTGVLMQGLTFHESVNAGEWMLVDHEVPYAGNGRAYGRAQVFSRQGQLIASVTQDALIRAMVQSGSSGAKL